MERVRRLYELPRYQEELKAIARAEVSREFCGHTLEHFLDVARLMYIRSLEEGEIVNREVIYAAALLHDLGRGMQYREGIPHQEAGVLLARELLPACRFDEKEIRQIVSAIGSHRRQQEGQETLARYLYQADKQSRNCFACPASDRCNWPEEKKNHGIIR